MWLRDVVPRERGIRPSPRRQVSLATCQLVGQSTPTHPNPNPNPNPNPDPNPNLNPNPNPDPNPNPNPNPNPLARQLPFLHANF